MESTTLETDVVTDTSAADTSPAAIAELVDDELLVEEISIDGMCGVY
jgi:mycofactocin precursor